MSVLTTIFYFAIVLFTIVFVHEYGHFIVASKCGVKIEEFAIGMGTKLLGFNDKRGVLWKFCLFPVGGYVKMYGDDNATSFGGYSDNPSEDELKYSLIYKHPLKKIAVAFAGPAMNFILGVILFFAVFSFQGQPIVKPIVTEVLKNSYAAKVGIAINDTLLEVNGQKINTFNDVIEQLNTSDKTHINLKISRNNEVLTLNAAYNKDKIFGIKCNKIYYKKINPLQAIIESFIHTTNITTGTIKAICDIVVHQRGMKNIGGPIAIAKKSAEAGNIGIWALLNFIAIISISLGAINLLPIPMLDGGHIVVNFIELITHRRFSNFAYKIFVYIGIACLILLMGIGFINDLFINR